MTEPFRCHPADDGPVDLEALGLDADLLERLRRALDDEVPAFVVKEARDAFSFRTGAGRLGHAELVYDSALEDLAASGVRGAGPRLLSFEHPELSVEIELVDTDRVEGQLIPPQPGLVEVRHAGGVELCEADPVGRFGAEGLRPGPVSLRCYPAGPGARGVATDWVII